MKQEENGTSITVRRINTVIVQCMMKLVAALRYFVLNGPNHERKDCHTSYSFPSFSYLPGEGLANAAPYQSREVQ